jgi:DNA phosphorothioation-associated putative methyltransferase
LTLLVEAAEPVVVERQWTAMSRVELSRPIVRAMTDGLLDPGTSIFDYGCGRGGDVQRLSALGYDVDGWDPAHRSNVPQRAADLVNLGYVVNVIEDANERADALRRAWDLARSILVVAARPDWESPLVPGRAYRDGILTRRGTFQKFYAQEELRAWIEQVIGVRGIAAAPGIFYVFRDEIRAQTFLASRVRRRPATTRRPRVTEALYDRHRDILDPLAAFVEARGRAPEEFELEQAAAVREQFGSIRAALALVRRVTGAAVWEAARLAAVNDLTVYLALAAFARRPKFGGLPDDIQVDVRTFFGSYKEACSAADDLLYGVADQDAVDNACRDSLVGKLTPEALYVHVETAGELPPLLRVYEGCAKALIGTVENSTLIKLNRAEPRVSYLSYPLFDQDPHPALSTSTRADLRRLDVKFTDYRGRGNPPILHRKETFVAADHPLYQKFARLTRQEERLGLLDDASGIGTRERWMSLVRSRGLQFHGHSLRRAPNVPVTPDNEAQRQLDGPAPAISLARDAGSDLARPAPTVPRPAVTRCRHGLALGSCMLCPPRVLPKS